MSITVELKHPIQAHGEELATLKLRRPNFGDLMQLDPIKGEMGKMAKLIELCAAIPPSAVKTIDVEDISAISEALAPFFGAFQLTGENAE